MAEVFLGIGGFLVGAVIATCFWTIWSNRYPWEH